MFACSSCPSIQEENTRKFILSCCKIRCKWYLCLITYSFLKLKWIRILEAKNSLRGLSTSAKYRQSLWASVSWARYWRKCQIWEQNEAVISFSYFEDWKTMWRETTISSESNAVRFSETDLGLSHLSSLGFI